MQKYRRLYKLEEVECGDGGTDLMELQDKEKNEPVQGLGKQSTGGKDKAGLPAGRIRPATLFYPAQHLVSTRRQR